MRFRFKPGQKPYVKDQDPIIQKTPDNWTTDGKTSSAAGFFSNLVLIVGALIFALLINQYVFQSYEVDGNSMEPTLHNKDRLIIWKLPKTWSLLTNKAYQPSRGDIVVFHKPDGSNEQLIKRVMALPGERVLVKDGTITVYNSQNPGGIRPDEQPYGKNLAITNGYVDVTVGPGEIFVVGDNRIPGASLDSRSALGNVPLDKVVGKLVLRLYPFNQMDTY